MSIRDRKKKCGRVDTHKIRTNVKNGRVNKEEESITVRMSKDENKIHIKNQAKLAVGSLTADLEAFKGLKHSFKIIAD